MSIPLLMMRRSGFRVALISLVFALLWPAPASAVPLTFLDDFETGPEWGIFEEIVGGNPCYDSEIGEVARETYLAHAGARGLHVWAGKVRGDSSNHVIGQKRISDTPVEGLLHYEAFARIDSALAWGQSGPEWSVQVTRQDGAVWLTRTGGFQYLPWSDSWQIWDSGTWTTFLVMPLVRDTWYFVAFRADWTAGRYDRLWVKGGSIDTVVGISAYRISPENKGFTDSAVWLTLEAENLWTNCQWDTDFRVVYDDVRFYPPPSGVASLVAANETAVSLAAPVATGDSFVEIHLPRGETTAGALATAAATGTGEDFSVATRLVSSGDTATFRVWTTEVSPVVWLGVRSDTATLAGLPTGIPATEAGRRAFGATVVLAEFGGSNGLMIGDTATTSRIADSYAYTILYDLSAATAGLYRDLGFDTAPGSSSFRFWYADTFGGAWTQDTTVTVTVAAGAGGGIRVTVAGITKDLPGGLGGADASSSLSVTGSNCLFTAAGLPGRILPMLRLLRDLLLATPIGRIAAGIFYLA